VRTLGAAVLLLCVGCGASERASDTSAAAQDGAVDTGHVSGWLDPDDNQLPAQPATYFPVCNGTPLVTRDSLGPVRPGATLADLSRRCPRQFRYWHWNEGAPTPAIALRVANALVRVLVDDTLPTSAIDRLLSSDSTARTAQGIGPRSTLAALDRAHGPLRFQIAECAIHASAPRRPGMSWILALPHGWDCSDLDAVEQGKRRPPDSARVHTTIVYRRRPPVTCATRPIAITADSIGALPRAATIGALRKLCGARDTTAAGVEREHSALVFQFDELRVLAVQLQGKLDDDAPADVWRVRGCGGLLFDKVATCATWSEVIGAFGMAGTGSTEFGPAAVRLESMAGVSLEFDVTGEHVGSLEAQPDLSRMPGRARLVQITLARP
jgi:hypothetical protein